MLAVTEWNTRPIQILILAFAQLRSVRQPLRERLQVSIQTRPIISESGRQERGSPIRIIQSRFGSRHHDKAMAKEYNAKA